MNRHTAAATSTATVAARLTAVEMTTARQGMAGTIATLATHIYGENKRHGLLLAVEAYDLIKWETNPPPAIKHAIWQVLTTGTVMTTTGTLKMETAVMHNKKWVVIREADETFRLLDLDADNPSNGSLQIAIDEPLEILDAFVSSDEHWLAVRTKSNRAFLYDLTQSDFWREPIVLTAESVIEQLLFSPNSGWLGTVGKDSHHVEVWQMQQDGVSQKILLPPLGDGVGETAVSLANVTSMGFDFSGQWAAVGYADGTVALWDLHMVQRQTEIVPILLQTNGVTITAVSFAANNEWLMATTQQADGSPINYLWHLDIESLLKQACATAGGNFTDQEWENYFSPLPYHATCTGY
ncbi:MAG: WD40 repeat domain-containing protein [Ardenticatenaceae bacterium]|nr:WD40 repeat domain-containing protein [Ardenticatenaceae bacterium]